MIPAPRNRLVRLNYCQASRRPAAASRLRCAGVVFLVNLVAPWPIIAASGSTASHLHPTNSAGMQLQFHDLIVSIKDRFALTPSRTVFSGTAKVRCRCRCRCIFLFLFSGLPNAVSSLANALPTLLAPKTKGFSHGWQLCKAQFLADLGALNHQLRDGTPDVLNVPGSLPQTQRKCLFLQKSSPFWGPARWLCLRAPIWRR